MDNEIIGKVTYKNAKIEFKGNHNIFICKDELTLKDCNIRFTGSNSVIYIDKNNYPISINMRVGNDSVIYIGKKCYTNKTSHIYATERKNVIIGDEILLSFDSYFRTADPHIIYDCNTKERINFSKSILVGDKVWIGQQSLLLKGTIIGSGSIIGGHSVVSNKIIKSNSLYAGNPAKKIREQVFYASPQSTHDLNEEEEMNTRVYHGDSHYIYEKDEDTISLKTIDEQLQKMKTTKEKIDYIEKYIVNNSSKNRFYQD